MIVKIVVNIDDVIFPRIVKSVMDDDNMPGNTKSWLPRLRDQSSPSLKNRLENDEQLSLTSTAGNTPWSDL